MQRAIGPVLFVLLAGLAIGLWLRTTSDDAAAGGRKAGELQVVADATDPRGAGRPDPADTGQPVRQGTTNPAGAAPDRGAGSKRRILVHGRIVTEVEEKPVTGAIVHLAAGLAGRRLHYLDQQVSDGDGRFGFGMDATRDLSAEEREFAELVVFATCPGFVPGAAILGEFDLASDDPGDEVLVELERGATWSGRVLNASGAAVAGADVRLDTDSGDLFETFTDPDGLYHLLPPADYPCVVSAAAVGLGSAQARLAKRPAVDGFPDLVLGGAALTGQIVFTSGEPVAGRRVSFDRNSEGDNTGEPASHGAALDSGTVSTDAQGRFRIAGVRRGRYELSLRVPIPADREDEVPLPGLVATGDQPARFVVQRVVVRVHAPTDSRLDRVALGFAATVRQGILDRFRQDRLSPAEWAAVFSWGYEQSGQWTNRDYEVLTPVGTMLMVRVYDGRHGLAKQLVEVQGGSPTQRVDLHFAAGQVRFRVSALGVDGKPVPVRSVTVTSGEGLDIAGFRDGDAATGLLPAGRYRFTVQPQVNFGTWQLSSGTSHPHIYLPVTREVELRDGGPSEVPIRLVRGGHVRVELTADRALDGRRANGYAIVGRHIETGEEVHLRGFTSRSLRGPRHGVYFNTVLYGEDALRPGAWRFELRGRDDKTQVQVGAIVPGRFCVLRFTATTRGR